MVATLPASRKARIGVCLDPTTASALRCGRIPVSFAAPWPLRAGTSRAPRQLPLEPVQNHSLGRRIQGIDIPCRLWRLTSRINKNRMIKDDFIHLCARLRDYFRECLAAASPEEGARPAQDKFGELALELFQLQYAGNGA